MGVAWVVFLAGAAVLWGLMVWVLWSASAAGENEKGIRPLFSVLPGREDR